MHYVGKQFQHYGITYHQKASSTAVELIIDVQNLPRAVRCSRIRDCLLVDIDNVKERVVATSTFGSKGSLRWACSITGQTKSYRFAHVLTHIMLTNNRAIANVDIHEYQERGRHASSRPLHHCRGRAFRRKCSSNGSAMATYGTQEPGGPYVCTWRMHICVLSGRVAAR